MNGDQVTVREVATTVLCLVLRETVTEQILCSYNYKVVPGTAAAVKASDRR